MNQLRRIEISGYKSIRDTRLELRPINLLIGANGAGKSNFISFFRLLNFMSTEALQELVGRAGGADSLLSYGSKETLQMQASLTFETPTGTTTYDMRLVHAEPDTLIFTDEHVTFHRSGYPEPQRVFLGSGQKESKLLDSENPTAKVVLLLLSRCRVYQFHDTSETAKLRKGSYIGDNRYLRHDAGNLAAFLYRLQQRQPEHYRRIVGVIRQLVPFFKDFELSPSQLNPNTILLNWNERDSDYLFGPHQLSDGTLRTMALVTLLLQPENELPDVILLDELELGLHPYAIGILAELLRSVSQQCRIIAATQSVALVDHLEPEDIVVVERKESNSVFSRLDSGDLKDWLEEYSLSELWEKNVIGGRPVV